MQDIPKKIKGSMQELKGNWKLQSPHLTEKVEGVIDKTKGKWNQTMSNTDDVDDDKLE